MAESPSAAASHYTHQPSPSGRRPRAGWLESGGGGGGEGGQSRLSSYTLRLEIRLDGGQGGVPPPKAGTTLGSQNRQNPIWLVKKIHQNWDEFF